MHLTPPYKHSAVQREAGCVLPLEALPVKQTLSLVNKGPPQLLSIETLAKIATEPFLSPPPAPPSSIHLYYLEPWGSVLPWILLSWLQTTTQMYRKWRRTKEKGRAGAIRGLRGSITSAWWRSSCDKSQGSGRGGKDGEVGHHLFNDRWRSGQSFRGTWARLKRMSGIPAGCFLYGAPVVSKGTAQSIFWSHLERYNNTFHIFQKHPSVHTRRKLCPHLNPATYV